MDVTVTSAFCFLLLILPQISLQLVCTIPPRVDIPENNEVGAIVANITLGTDVTLELKPNPNNFFTLDGDQLKAAVVFDYETLQSFSIEITCIPPIGPRENHDIAIIVVDVNDNAPFFEESLYLVTINELSPPKTVVDTFAAADRDENTKLYYALTPDSEGFSLEPFGVRAVRIVTTKSFDYDKDKFFLLRLYVQDTPLGSSDHPSFNNTTNVNVTIADIDNRPPCFEPCNKIEISGTTVYVSQQSYTGSVYLKEQQTGALTLKPNQILAEDGDSGLNEKIVYSILRGNDNDVFEIDSSTGSITMLKPVTTSGTITLTVLAAQEVNVHQFAITSVSIAVFARSEHNPQFPWPLYEGIVTEIGMMAKNRSDMGQLLRILATDADYGEEGNPNITYSVIGNDGFALNNGYLFMATQVADGTYSLQVRAVDSSTDESATTQVSVEVKSSPTVPPSTSTTGSETPSTAVSSLSPGTTISGATPTASQPPPDTGPTESTSIPSVSTPVETTATSVTPGNTTPSANSSVPTPVVTTATGVTPGYTTPSGNTSVSTPVQTTITGVTPGNITPSGNPSVDTAGTTADGTATSSDSSAVSTPFPNPTGDGAVSTANTQRPTGGTPGGFDSRDMAALGATLGVLLFLALVIMGILFFRLRRENKDWKKIHESNVFRSSLGQKSGGAKEGIQYTNKAFDNDEDDSGGPGSPVYGVVLSTHADAKDYSKYESIVEPKLPPQGDDSSQSGSEKEVKPILTKERRVEEGYKSVWFKEDIDPNAKEEVVIIPDSRENGSDEDEDSSSDKESGDESPRRRRVLFSDLADKKGGEVLSIDL